VVIVNASMGTNLGEMAGFVAASGEGHAQLAGDSHQLCLQDYHTMINTTKNTVYKQQFINITIAQSIIICVATYMYMCFKYLK